MRFWLWLRDLASGPPQPAAYAPYEEVNRHGEVVAARRYAVIRELEKEYGRDYPPEDWMNRKLRERGVGWRVRDRPEYWETVDPGYIFEGKKTKIEPEDDLG